jgi:hypothetical protein
MRPGLIDVGGIAIAAATILFAANAQPCSTDVDCDNGLFCDGVEICVGGSCGSGVSPCTPPDVCNDVTDRCESSCPRPDADGDGSIRMGCGGDDCDDTDARRFPGNVEVCDAENLDEDCDSDTFGDRDQDGDGFIDAQCCNQASDGTINCGPDCNDQDPGTNPIVPEVCNGFDDDCDGSIDDAPGVSVYPDNDMDGFGAVGAVAQFMCPGVGNFSPYANDCDDTNAAIVPGAMRCSGESQREVEICQSDGSILTASCPSEGDSVCVPQPNGTGDCEPTKKPRDVD